MIQNIAGIGACIFTFLHFLVALLVFGFLFKVIPQKLKLPMDFFKFSLEVLY